MTQTPSSDPTPEETERAVGENQPGQPLQPQPGVGVETETGTDTPPDTEPDEVEH